MNKIKISVIVCLLMFSTCVVAQNKYDDKGFEISKNLEIFSTVYKNLQLNYVDDIEPGKLMKTAIDAMLASLDPYTVYIPESEIEDVKMQLMGQYGGIGMLIHQRGDYVYASEPYEGMPADLAGLKAGDKILEIDGQSAEGKTTAEVSSALRGQAGTELKVKIERDGKVLEKTLTRREIKLKPVPYYGLVDNDYGYIKLNEFTQNASKDVKDAFLTLKSKNSNLKGLILDLRGNGGGLLNEAVDLVNIFVNKHELVVQTKGKVASRNTKHHTRNAPVDKDIPIVVLIDGYSASASEIVAGSLQDLDRAVVIGSRSFGKGLVQNILPLTYNSQMKVTVSKYYIPSGRCIQALDYAHRDENGRATKVPDSLKTAFKTRNGRVVYDGFGIEPDVEIVDSSMVGNITVALVRNMLIFDYATDYAKKHFSILPAADFEITDEIYADFTDFLKDKKYEYSTSTEKALELLKEAAKDEKYIESIADDIEKLIQKVHSDKAIDLQKNREDISGFIKSELLTRYYYEKGRIEGMLNNDDEVKAAIEILSDKDSYNNILTHGK
ncbi:MAG: S41 family peptidase [Bacteroidales bacterium]|nr:S41 family peptidase [Bacteroidales bacterium]